MSIPWLLFVLGCVLAVVYLPFTADQPSLSRSLRKTAPLLLFAIAAWTHGGPVLLGFALAFSALGDWSLSRPSDRMFLVGMGAFALAHLAYLALMLGAVPELGPYWPLGILVLGLGASTEFWLIPKTGDLRQPVRAYIGVIMAMGLSALMLPVGFELVMIGAGLFILSDLILSVEIFVLDAQHPRRFQLSRAVWVTYIVAQIALFLGLGAQ